MTNVNNNNRPNNTPTAASAQLAFQQAIQKKMALSSYGHSTNGIRVVSGKLKTLTVSWLGALEGSHFGHLLRREYFGSTTANTNSTTSNQQQQNPNDPFTASPALFAEPASKRA